MTQKEAKKLIKEADREYKKAFKILDHCLKNNCSKDDFIEIRRQSAYHQGIYQGQLLLINKLLK